MSMTWRAPVIDVAGKADVKYSSNIRRALGRGRGRGRAATLRASVTADRAYLEAVAHADVPRRHVHQDAGHKERAQPPHPRAWQILLDASER